MLIHVTVTENVKLYKKAYSDININSETVTLTLTVTFISIHHGVLPQQSFTH